MTYKEFMALTDSEQDDYLYQAITNHERVDGDILREMYYSDFFDVIDKECDMDDAGRWSVPVTLIFSYRDKYYSIWYDKGLTEYQENEWESQVIQEVVRVPVTVYVWHPVN